MAEGVLPDIPGWRPRRITRVVFDFNGTLATDGRLIPGVKPRLERLARIAEVFVLTADTFGTARRALGPLVRIVRTGADKRRFVRSGGAHRTAVVGNGVNDIPMFRAAALGIGVVGEEGASGELLRAATVVVRHIRDALDLLLSPKRMIATLRK